MAEKSLPKLLGLSLAVLFCLGPACGARTKLRQTEGFVKKEGAFSVLSLEGKAFFEKACSGYLEVYVQNSRLFNLKKIRHAVHTCFLAQDYETTRSFLRFQDDYFLSHPEEALRNEPWLESAREPRKAAPPPHASKTPVKSQLKPLFS